jgi:hypothetical protein
MNDELDSNRRRSPRLKIDRRLRVQVQLHPVMPFIGESVDAVLVNLSEGGMALMIPRGRKKDRPPIPRGAKIKIHFRLPGGPLRECLAAVSHSVRTKQGDDIIGLRFLGVPAGLRDVFRQMLADNEACDDRVRLHDYAWCDPSCAFSALCRKPIRNENPAFLDVSAIEIALQYAE